MCPETEKIRSHRMKETRKRGGKVNPRRILVHNSTHLFPECSGSSHQSKLRRSRISRTLVPHNCRRFARVDPGTGLNVGPSTTLDSSLEISHSGVAQGVWREARRSGFGHPRREVFTLVA